VKARLHFQQTVEISEGVTAELIAWELPRRLPGSDHAFKYRMALVVDGECVMRFDNESGKGDHRHQGSREFAYDFRSLDDLEIDFWNEVWKWLNQRGS
jgi:hypothetical protein